MARTVHHTPWRRRDAEVHERHDALDCHEYVHSPQSWSWDCNFTGPEHTIVDRRYSAATLTAAEEAGTRPVPHERTITWGRVGMPRAYVNCRSLGEDCRLDERAARARLREDLIAARGYANAAFRHHDRADDLDAESEDWDNGWDGLDTIEIRPVRHRNNALYNQW